MAWHDQSWPRSHGQRQLVASGRGRRQTGIFLGRRDPPPAPQGGQGPVPMSVLFLGAWGDRRDMPLPRDRRASVILGAAGDTAPCPPPALGMVGAERAAPGTGSCQTSAQAASPDANGAATSRRCGEGCSGRPLCGRAAGFPGQACQGGWGGHRHCRYDGHSSLISAKPRGPGSSPRWQQQHGAVFHPPLSRLL